MALTSLIDRNFSSVSILEDMEEVGIWLKDRDYYAVIDEESRTVGIITLRDYLQYPHHQVIDANFRKPVISPDMELKEVFTLMEQSQSEYLPVFQAQYFMGVISMWSITRYLLEAVNELEHHEMES